MKIYNCIEGISLKDSVITIGKFNGIHLGHKELITKGLELSKEYNMPLVVISLVSEKLENKLILLSEEKCEYLETLGVDIYIEQPLTREFMNIDREDFLRGILLGKLNLRHIVIGEDFKFGAFLKGDKEYLLREERIFNYKTHIIPDIIMDNKRISSTSIKEMLFNGEIKEANNRLGYNFFYEGIVERGNRIGRSIGFPTVNILISKEKLKVKYGVYRGKIKIGDKEYNTLLNVGIKPSINGIYDPSVEAYIYDFSKDIYNEYVKVELNEFIREEKKFNSIEELKNQIKKDMNL